MPLNERDFFHVVEYLLVSVLWNFGMVVTFFSIRSESIMTKLSTTYA